MEPPVDTAAQQTGPGVVEDASPSGGDVIVARAGRYYRNARYIMVLFCVGMGAYFAYDGWKGYPNANAQARAQGFEKLPHSEFDISLQKKLAGLLPLVGAAILVRMLVRSRGEYRLQDNTLHVPGHPPVPLESIREIDKTRWDRKGIVSLTYEVPGTSGTSRLTLDDFVYDQKPTDAIAERIEKLLVPAEGAERGDSTEA